MQFSVIIGVPLLYKAGFGGGQVTDENLIQAQGLWSVISFVIGLVIVLLILRTAPKRTLHNEKRLRSAFPSCGRLSVFSSPLFLR